MRCTLPSLNSCDPVGVSANSVPKEVNIDRTPKIQFVGARAHQSPSLSPALCTQPER
jgi:hypothetical protein